MNVKSIIPGWFSIPGAMRYTGFSEASIRDAMKLKLFPVHRVEIHGKGRKQNIRIRREDLDAWITSTPSQSLT
jgi:predicted DNA-binding transcriptional regulator AlpA